nr:hypothetical protein BaRGS_021670 [Batillaria attramentaria]
MARSSKRGKRRNNYNDNNHNNNSSVVDDDDNNSKYNHNTADNNSDHHHDNDASSNNSDNSSYNNYTSSDNNDNSSYHNHNSFNDNSGCEDDHNHFHDCNNSGGNNHSIPYHNVYLSFTRNTYDCFSSNGNNGSSQCCYHLVLNHHRVFPAAERECEAGGPHGHLAIIRDAATNQFLYDKLYNDLHYVGVVFIGLTDRRTEGDWRWVDGSAASYQNWAPGQNTNQQLNVEDCAVMDTRSGGKWNDYQCVDTLFVLHEYPFICEYQRECEAGGPHGHLAIIRDPATNQFLYDKLYHDLHYGGVVFIGLTDMRKEGDWRWVDGSAATYFNWAPQQNTPLQHNVQDCVVMDTTAGGKWKDYQCADALFVKHEHSFICEYLL